MVSEVRKVISFQVDPTDVSAYTEHDQEMLKAWRKGFMDWVMGHSSPRTYTVLVDGSRHLWPFYMRGYWAARNGETALWQFCIDGVPVGDPVEGTAPPVQL